MLARISPLIASVLIALACGFGASDPPAPQPEAPTEPSAAPPAASDPLALASEDPKALCRALAPADPHALGVSDRWSHDRSLTARTLYANRRISCAFDGQDPNRPVSRAPKYLEFEVECGKRDPAAVCEARLSEAQLRGYEVFDTPIEGALCHTLHLGGTGNWVVLPNGCFVILYRAQHDIIGVEPEERDRLARSTRLGVAQAIVNNILDR